MNRNVTPVDPAYELVPDAYKTYGPEVGELAALAEIPPDESQQKCLDAIFAVDKHDKSVAFEAAVIACRQNLKTAIFKQAVLGWLFFSKERLVIWSSHEFASAREVFYDFEYIFTHTELSSEIDRIHRSTGNQSFVMNSGARLVFKTRTGGGGRGFSGQKVILDEAYALTAEHMGALLPTLSAQTDPQVLYGSSAGHADSATLRGVRDRGRNGQGSKLAYFEWCAPPPSESCDKGEYCDHSPGTRGCGCDKPELWRLANPAMGIRITEEYIANEREALPPEEFARERMGWWDDPVEGEAGLPVKHWHDLEDINTSRPIRPVLSLDITPDQTMASIGSAGRCDDGNVHIDLLEHRRGIKWILDRLDELVEQTDACAVSLYAGSVAAMMIPALNERGYVTEPTGNQVRLHLLSKRDYARACGAFADHVYSETLRHRNREPLNDAVESVKKKALDEAFYWYRGSSTVDLCPLVAVTAATYTYSVYGVRRTDPQPMFAFG